MAVKPRIRAPRLGVEEGTDTEGKIKKDEGGKSERRRGPEIGRVILVGAALRRERAGRSRRKAAPTGSHLQLLLDEVAERAHRGVDLVGPRHAAAQAQAVPVAVLQREEAAGRSVDLVLQRVLAEAERVH